MTTEDTVTTKAASAARNAKAATAATADVAKDQFARVAETQFKAADDAAAFSKSNVDAVIQASSTLFHGVEEITRAVVGITQAQFESSINVAKALITVKSLSEFTDLQNAYAKTAFDNVVSEATRLSELAVRVANDTVQPLNARVTASIEQLSRTAAL